MNPYVSVQNHDVRNSGIPGIAELLQKRYKPLRFCNKSGMSGLVEFMISQKPCKSMGKPYVLQVAARCQKPL